MSKKHTPKKKKEQHFKSTVVRDFSEQPETSERTQRIVKHKQAISSQGDFDGLKKQSSQSMEPAPKSENMSKSTLKPKLASKQIENLKKN